MGNSILNELRPDHLVTVSSVKTFQMALGIEGGLDLTEVVKRFVEQLSGESVAPLVRSSDDPSDSPPDRVGQDAQRHCDAVGVCSPDVLCRRLHVPAVELGIDAGLFDYKDIDPQLEEVM